MLVEYRGKVKVQLFYNENDRIWAAESIEVYESEATAWEGLGETADNYDLLLVEYPEGVLTSYVSKGKPSPLGGNKTMGPYKWSCINDGINCHGLRFDESKGTI